MPHDSDPTSDRPEKTPLHDATTESHAATAGRKQAADATLPKGSVFGHYTIEDVLGAGGMGVVYRARQERPAREVALKVIRPGFASSQALRRFELEAEVLGRLQHPGIAQVYEAGTAHDQPFFAMELVRGEPLTRFAEARELSTRARLELFARVCDAVQHAHTKGVIHRDLKPGNILVDASGQPKILDFGVARLTQHDVQAVTIQTDIGQLIGTVPYMSPEQVEGDPANLDTRSDVYALGVILFELLTGRLPYDLSKKLIHEAARIIREDEPTRLSSINRTLRGDIETIALKALEKDKGRRYQAASDLGSDITRFLRDEPIVARPASRSYQLRKFAQRNKALVGGVVAAFLLLALGLAGTSWGLVRAEAQRRRADERAEAAQRAEAAASAARDAEKARADELKRVSEFQSQMLGQIDTTRAGAELMKDVRERFAAALEKTGIPEDERAAQLEALSKQLARVNATDAAAALIDRTILTPAVKAIDEQFKDQPAVDAQLRQALADLYETIGLYDAAMPLQVSALETRRRVLGNDHSDTVRSMTNLAGLHLATAEYDEAERYAREAMIASQRSLGPDHSLTLAAVNNLGLALRDIGRRAEAERWLNEGLVASRRVLGSEHPETLPAINNYALSLEDQGKLAEAERVYREGLEISRRVLGASDRRTLVFKHNLASVLTDLGKVAEAEVLYRESLDECRQVFGEEHPETLSSIAQLGGLLLAQGRLAEAEPFLREDLEKSRRVLGDEHPSTLTSISNMGSLLRAQGKLDEAEPYLREALEKSRRVLGDEHPSTLTSIYAFGRLLQDQGRLDEAEPYLREELEKSRRVLGDEHPGTLTSISNMGTLLRAQGRLAEAEPYWREALERRRRVLGEEHPDTLPSINSMGLLLRAQGKLAEAEPYWRGALEKRRSVLGNEHPDTLISLHNLGLLLRDLDRIGEAEACHREALEGRRSVLGEGHAATIVSLSELGVVLNQLGKYEEAEACHRGALAGRCRLLGPDDPLTIASITHLGISIEGQGRLAEAEPFYLEALSERLRVQGPEHMESLVALANLGFLRLSQGRNEDAVNLLAPEEDAARRVLVGDRERSLGRFLTFLGRARARLPFDAQRFALAESNLIEAHSIASIYRGEQHPHTLDAVRSLVELYTTWHAAEPGKGYDLKAAEWKAKLDEAAAPPSPAPAR